MNDEKSFSEEYKHQLILRQFYPGDSRDYEYISAFFCPYCKYFIYKDDSFNRTCRFRLCSIMQDCKNIIQKITVIENAGFIFEGRFYNRLKEVINDANTIYMRQLLTVLQDNSNVEDIKDILYLFSIYISNIFFYFKNIEFIKFEKEGLI